MRWKLLTLAAALLFPSLAFADSNVPALPAATTLSGATAYLANGGALNNSVGLSTSVFDISAGNIILKAGGVSDAALASTFVKTLTTTGTSGAATLVGSTLNIPQYTGGGNSFTGSANDILTYASPTTNGHITPGTGVATFLATPSAANFLTMTGVLGVGSLPALTHSNFFVGDGSDRPVAASVTGDLGFGTAAAGFVTGTVTGFQGRAFASTAPSDTNVICWDAGGTTWKPCTATGGSVSVTAGTPNVVITPSPGTGTFTVGSTNAQNTPADGGSHSYTVLSGDNTKEVILASTFTALAVPQATSSFGAGYSFSGVTKSAVTATSTTSTVNGIAGATGIKLGANQLSSWDSDGTNWLVGLGVPQPATQTGTTFLRDDMTWQTPAGSGNVATSGTLTSGKIVIGQGTTTVDVDASASLATGALTLGASGTAGSVAMGNATSGTVTIQPVAGALGTVTASLPANTGTIAELNLAQTWTAAQTFTNSDVKLLGSSTGATTFTSANAGSSNFTLTFPAVTDTLAVLGTAQTFTAVQTFTPAPVETAVALSGCNGSTATMDLTAGSLFHCTVSAGGVTFAVSNPAASGKVSSFTMELTNPGSQTLTFMSGTKWPGGSQPAWTAAGVDVAVCYTDDGATTWRCARSMADSK